MEDKTYIGKNLQGVVRHGSGLAHSPADGTNYLEENSEPAFLFQDLDDD